MIYLLAALAGATGGAWCALVLVVGKVLARRLRGEPPLLRLEPGGRVRTELGDRWVIVSADRSWRMGGPPTLTVTLTTEDRP